MPSLLLHKTSEGDTIGEGSVVQLIGFPIKPSSRTSGKGETVNCELPDREENDNHINIVKDKPPLEPTAKQLQDLDCRSVVVESHPTSGQSRGNRLGKLVKTPPIRPPPRRSRPVDLRRPMRFTGHLFFDVSHKPCTGDHTARQLPPDLSLGDSPPSLASRSA